MKKSKLVASIATIAVFAGIGAYFLMDEKKKKTVKKWIVDMKSDILKELRKLKEISEDQYNRIVDEVSEKYSNIKEIAEDEIKVIKKDLKNAFNKIVKEMK